MYEQPGAPPPLYASPKKRFPVVGFVLSLAALLIALAVVGGIAAFRAMKAGTTAATQVGDRYLDAMGRHDYSAASALFVPEVRVKATAGDLRDIETLIEKHHGAYVSHGTPGWFVQTVNGQSSVRLTYPMQYAQGPNAVTLVLMKSADGGYQISDAHYEEL